MKTPTTMNGNSSLVTAITWTVTALLLLGAACATGYVIGAAQHHEQRPEQHWLPDCDEFGFTLDPRHHKPTDAIRCNFTMEQWDRHLKLKMYRKDL